ncbi:MAG: hypothetical protein IPP48_05935 [Chitinophagaceae bacterium]|nr:hypothetical protein [Chitinophagaceae bacterium]
MKKISFLVCTCVLFAFHLQAQNTIVGKWKLEKMTFPDMGTMHINLNSIKELMYAERTALKKDTALTMVDSIEVEELSTALYNQFSAMRLDYKANKTYSGTFGGTTSTGTYIYNAAKNTLTNKPKNKPVKTTKVVFENGMLVMEDKTENITMYFVRIK